MKKTLCLIITSSILLTLCSCAGTYVPKRGSDPSALALVTMKPDTVLSVPEQTEPEIPEFKADISRYEQYMNPTGELRDAFLTLVNKEHPVGADYDPGTLELLPQKWCVYSGADQARMTPYAAQAMIAMLEEASANGITDVKITLAFRSYAKESQLYYGYIEEELAAHPGWTRAQATELVETYKSPPGKGEHMTGLCADMHNLYKKQGYNLDDFKNTEAYAWLRENCWKFGFILRFPEDKVDITGYKFESWHYRYVGRYHAERIYRSGLCLEEYLETLS